MRRRGAWGLGFGVAALFGAWVWWPGEVQPLSHDPELAALARELGQGLEPPAVGSGRPVGGRALPRVEADRHARALSQNPDDHSAWLALVALAAREGSVQRPGPVQSARLIERIGAIEPSHPDLAAARAWLALQRGDLEAARAALGPSPATLEGRAASLEIALRTGSDPAGAADAVLADDPGHPEACVARSRAALAAGDLARAGAVVTRCQQAGATRPELDRVAGEVWWALDRPLDAATSWRAAGMLLHAASAAALGGAPDWRTQAALAVAPVLGPDRVPAAASIQAIWLGLHADEERWVRAAVGRLQAATELDPTGRQALAAGLLRLEDAAAARSALEGLDGASAEVLRARALADLGDGAGARQAAERATTRAPHEAWTWRARLSVDPAAADLALARDPLAAALSRDVPAIDRPGSLVAPPTPLADPGLAAAVAPLHALGTSQPSHPVAAMWWSARLDRPLEGPGAAAAPARLQAWWVRAKGGTDPALLDATLTGRLLSAWVAAPPDADRIAADVVRDHPGVAGPLRERYLLGVRRPTGTVPSP